MFSKMKERKMAEKLDIRTLQRNYEDYGEKEVTVGGWVRSIRNSKNFSFSYFKRNTF